jgi:outer membrane biosynthesis protein TonB
MLTWLGKLLGITPADAPSEPTPVPAPAQAPKPKAEKKPAAKKAAPKAKAAPKPKAEAKPKAEKKPAAKKAAKKDDGLDAMNKRDLLAMAKDKGVKANASMNKEAVIKALRA